MKIVSAKHIKDYEVELTFSNGKVKIIDFSGKKFGRWFLGKWSKPENFVKFKIDKGNIVWGKDWDVIFHVEDLYRTK